MEYGNWFKTNLKIVFFSISASSLFELCNWCFFSAKNWLLEVESRVQAFCANDLSQVHLFFFTIIQIFVLIANIKFSSDFFSKM